MAIWSRSGLGFECLYPGVPEPSVVHPPFTHRYDEVSPASAVRGSALSREFSSVVKEIQRINLNELKAGTSGSWHDQYKGAVIWLRAAQSANKIAIDSAYIFVGGLHFGLTEGDVITIFSQSVFSWGVSGRGALLVLAGMVK